MSSAHDPYRGQGRGRGRGRGRGINTPAWMTKNDSLKRQLEHQPAPQNNQTRSSKDQPRRSHPETRKRQSSTVTVASSSKETQGPSSKKAKRPPESDTIMIDEELAAEMKRQEEQTNLQRQKEEEELIRLAEQFGDADDEENAFETEEEKEERLAGERREKRRNRLRGFQHDSPLMLQQEPIHDDDSGRGGDELTNESAVDRPRNPKGVIASEGEVVQQHLEMTASADTNVISNHDPEVRVRIDGNDDGNDDCDGKDSFDMFSSSSVSPPAPISTTAATGTGTDDAEGYYRATIGEIISFHPTASSFRVSGIIGKGVFSTVLKCTCVAPMSATTQILHNEDVVAIKLIRSNEIMTKAALKEVRILRLLNSRKKKKGHTTEEKYIVNMFELDDFQDDTAKNHHEHNVNSSLLLEHHNHTALLFEHMPFNLRETLSKFGKNVGINLSAVKSYAKQLLTALQHLASHRLVHADIKLDNILVSANFSTVKLCDFGSAFFETDTDNDPTPYLVSRFYRAPEIILGLEYDKMIDLWSVAVSLVELFTGTVLFAGRNNNDMLKKIVECIGPVSNKMIRRHVLSFKQMGLQPHFEPIVAGGSNYNFRKQEFDKVTGKPIIRVMSASSGTVSVKQIVQVLLKSRSATDNRADVIKFGEFLSKCLVLDPQKRMNIDEALDHDFFCVKNTMKEDD
eukprot:scaffold349_cov267-Chaetoceros_neogracile.AAC.47